MESEKNPKKAKKRRPKLSREQKLKLERHDQEKADVGALIFEALNPPEKKKQN